MDSYNIVESRIGVGMEYRKLGNTEVLVSVICLGTMNWGEQNTEAEAVEQMDYAVEQGINFFDTAELYPIPPNASSQGRTETYIGNWFKKTGKRKNIFLASKVVGPTEFRNMRGGVEPRLDSKNIKTAIEGSLKRLQTEVIDLYQIHWPQRDTNFFGKRGYTFDGSEDSGIEEVLEAMGELVAEGKVRYIGLSNETPWGVMEYLRLAKEKGYPKIVSIQNPYSLIMREYEIGLAEISIREKVGLLAYSPLSMGVLSGKYLGGKFPKNSRFDYSKRNNERYNPKEAQKAIEAYVKLAKKFHLDPAQMALAFVNQQKFLTSTIIGARTMQQLKTDIASIELKLSEKVLQEIEAIYREMPDPIA